MSRELPISFKGEMIKAIKKRLKHMTRRLKNLKKINNWPNRYVFDKFVENEKGELIANFYDTAELPFPVPIKCPYGKPGDILYVRETFRKYYPTDDYGEVDCSEMVYEYAADDPPMLYEMDGDGFQKYNKDGSEKFIPWRPSIHMPKSAARIWLMVTDIRVERLQEIKASDVQAEGAGQEVRQMWLFGLNAEQVDGVYRQSFRTLWTSINGDESWNHNPWVWVVSFVILSTTGKPDTTIKDKNIN